MPATQDQNSRKSDSAVFDSDTSVFLDSIQAIDVLVHSQTQALNKRGIPSNGVDQDVVNSVVQLATTRDASGERLKLLSRIVGELARRQLLLDQHHRDAEASIALQDFAGAAAKIRTALDLALSCSDEIRDIVTEGGPIEDIGEAAFSIGGAVRWAARYAEELSDLAAVEAKKSYPPENVLAADVLRRVSAKLQPIANHSSTQIHVVCDAALDLNIDCRNLQRCLDYLLLLNIGQTGVQRVTVTVTLERDLVRFSIEDDANLNITSAKMTSASQAQNAGENGAKSGQAAGYAVAKKLAEVIGGGIELTLLGGEKTKADLLVPRRPATAPMGAAKAE